MMHATESPTPQHIVYLSFEVMTPGRAADTHVRGLARGLTAIGNRVTIVCDENPKSEKSGVLGRISRYMRLYRKAAGSLTANSIMLVRSHPVMLPIVLLARFKGSRPVIEINGGPSDVGVTYKLSSLTIRATSYLTATAWRKAANLVAVTPGLANYAITVAPDVPVDVVPNGVDVTQFQPSGAPRPADVADVPYALFYGDVARWHGVEDIFDAVRTPDWPQDLHIVIIGRGSAVIKPEVPPDLAARVIWHDRMPQSQLIHYIANAELGLVPITNPGGRSDTGVLPLKLLETMACARPVIVTDLPGQRELVVAADCGRVVPVGDPRAIAKAAAEILAAPDQQDMGHRARAAVVASYDWTEVARTFMRAVTSKPR